MIVFYSSLCKTYCVSFSLTNICHFPNIFVMINLLENNFSLPLYKDSVVLISLSVVLLQKRDLLPPCQFIPSEGTIILFNWLFADTFLRAFKVSDVAISYLDCCKTPLCSFDFRGRTLLISCQSAAAKMILYSHCFHCDLFAFLSSYSFIIQTSNQRLSATMQTFHQGAVHWSILPYAYLLLLSNPMQLMLLFSQHTLPSFLFNGFCVLINRDFSFLVFLFNSNFL